jgi:hypothetical protein
LNYLVHDFFVFSGLGACGQILETLLHLVLQALSELVRWRLAVAVHSGGYGTLVGEVAGDSSLVLLLGATNEGRVEDETVFWRLSFGLQRPEQCLLGSQDLNGGRWVLRQVRQATCVGDELRADNVADECSQIRGNCVHSLLQVLGEGVPEGDELDAPLRKAFELEAVSLTDLLPHRDLGGIDDLLGLFLVKNDVGDPLFHLFVDTVARFHEVD